jgi:FkbH-like protein
MYEENAKRIEGMKNFSSLDDFLIDLNMTLHIEKAGMSTLARVHQMLQKTNQFNVTTKRYSENDLTSILNNHKMAIFLGKICDKYGDNGNSILTIVRIASDYDAEIDSFLMSCRIMSRGIEYGFLYEVEKILKSMGIKNIYATYEKTAKNSPASNFFENAGYKILEINDNKKTYKFNLVSGDIQERKKCYISII